MSMSEERIKILKMVQQGKITVEEGESLLEALVKSEVPEGEPQIQKERSEGKTLRIRVTEVDTGTQTINLRLPLTLARIVRSFIPEMEWHKLEQKGVNINAILKSIDEGEIGKIIEVDDAHDNQKVEVWIE